jgi:hypothetical protein
MFVYDYFDRIAIINPPDRNDRYDSLAPVQKGCVSIPSQRRGYDDIVLTGPVIAVARSVRHYYWRLRARTGITTEPSVLARRSL